MSLKAVEKEGSVDEDVVASNAYPSFQGMQAMQLNFSVTRGHLTGWELKENELFQKFELSGRPVGGYMC